MGATLQDTLAEYAADAKQLNTQAPAPVAPVKAASSGPVVQPTAEPATQANPTGKTGWARVGDILNPFSKAYATPQEIGGVAAAIPMAVVRAPGQLGGGLMDTGADIGKFAGDAMSGALVRSSQAAGLPGVTKYLQDNQAQADAQYKGKSNGTGSSLADVLSNRQSWGQVGNTAVNQFMTQALATIGGGPEGIIPKMVVAGARAAVTADTTPGASAGANLANRGVNAAIGAAGEGVITGAGALLARAQAGKLADVITEAVISKNAGKVVSEATPEEATADALNRTFAVKRTAEARFKASEAAAKDEPAEADPQELLNEGTRHSDVPPSAGNANVAGGDGVQPAHPLATDANAALDQAGAAERLPDGEPPKVTPDGRAIVEPATKSALDEANMGRGFIGSDEPTPSDHIIFKETDPEGGQRVVGSMDREGFNTFLEDAKRIGNDPSMINTTQEHPSGQINLRFGNADDVSAFGRAMVDRLPDLPEGSSISNPELLKAAQAAGGWEHPNDVKIQAAMMSAKTEDLTKGMLVSRLAANNINVRMSSLADTDWSQVALDDPRWVAAHEAYHNGYSFMQAFRQTKSEIARALQSMQINLDSPAVKLSGFNPEDAIAPQPVPDFDTWHNNFGKTPPEGLQPVPKGQVRPLPATPGEFDEAVKLWHAANQAGADAVNAFWKGVSFHPDALKFLRTSLANWYTAGLVSRPTTYMRDLIGPGVLSVYRTAEKTGGALIQIPRAITEAMTGGGDMSKVADLLAQAADGPVAYAKTLGDVGTSLKYAWQATRSGESRLGGAQPYNFNTKGIPQALIDAASNGSVGQSTMFSLGNAINKLPSAIHALHGGVNELALRLSYLGEIRAQGMLEARAQGLVGNEFNNFVKTRVQYSEDPLSGEATDLTQLANAQRTTFTKPVGDISTEPLVRTISNAINMARESVPELRAILPIYTVPANNLGETLRRLPGLGLMFKGTRAELSGASGAVAQAEAYGRQLTGAATLTGGFLLARNGTLTGAGPSNPKDNATWQAEGFQPYSFKVADKWYSYNKIDGLGSMLGIVANAYDQTIYKRPDNPSALPMASISALAEYFKDQSSLRGVSDFFDFGSNPAEDQGRLQQMLKGWSSGMVPGFLQEIRNHMDPDKRVTRSPAEAIMNALPGGSTQLDPVRNLWGQPVHVPNYELGILPISTSPTNPMKDDPDLAELHRIFQSTGWQPGVLPPGISGTGLDQRDAKLEDGRSLYDARMQYRHLVTDENDQTIQQAIHSVIQSDDYQSGFDGSARGHAIADDDETHNRTGMLEKVFTKFDTLAKHQVAQDSPLATSWLTAAAIKQANPVPGVHAHTVQELAASHSLVMALGINADEYVKKVQGQ